MATTATERLLIITTLRYLFQDLQRIVEGQTSNLIPKQTLISAGSLFGGSELTFYFIRFDSLSNYLTTFEGVILQIDKTTKLALLMDELDQALYTKKEDYANQVLIKKLFLDFWQAEKTRVESLEVNKEGWILQFQNSWLGQSQGDIYKFYPGLKEWYVKYEQFKQTLVKEKLI